MGVQVCLIHSQYALKNQEILNENWIPSFGEQGKYQGTKDRVVNRNLCSFTTKVHPGGAEATPFSPCSQIGILIAQLIKNLPAMQETPARFLSWEGLLEKG